MKLDAPIALGLTLITVARFITGCGWWEAHHVEVEAATAAAGAAACELERLDVGDPEVLAGICKGLTEAEQLEARAAVLAHAKALPPQPVRPSTVTGTHPATGRPLWQVRDQRAVRAVSYTVDAGAEGGR